MHIRSGISTFEAPSVMLFLDTGSYKMTKFFCGIAKKGCFK